MSWQSEHNWPRPVLHQRFGRSIQKFSNADVTGVTINDYQARGSAGFILLSRSWTVPLAGSPRKKVHEKRVQLCLSKPHSIRAAQGLLLYLCCSMS